MSKLFTAALLVACLAAPASFAQDAQLSLGDPVPAIDIAQFFQGDAIEEFSKEKTYVLEFWATW